MELAVLHRRVALDQGAAGMAAACARLPPDVARLDSAAWATLLTDERYRPICPAQASDR